MSPAHETPDLYGAFPRLGPEETALLAAYGTRHPTLPGEVLIREGERWPAFYVVLDGTVAVIEASGHEERVRAVHGPGRFLGGLGLLTGQAEDLRAVACDPGVVLSVPVADLRGVVDEHPGIGDVILRAYLIRRGVLAELESGLRILGSRHAPGSRRLREFAARNRLPHKWIDLEDDKEARQLLDHLGFTPADVPVVILHGEKVLRAPGDAEVARAGGIPAPLAREMVGDLVVVGAGPAGLATALYAASEGLSTVVVDAVATGGQAAACARTKNHLGFPAGISGGELAERAADQAREAGAEFTVPARAVSLNRRERYYVVGLEDGRSVNAHTVVVATGVRYRTLEVPGAAEFQGAGLHYAATLTEAKLCLRAPVVVVGGGNDAGQAAIYLARRAARVRLLVPSADLGRSMSRYLADELRRDPGVRILLNTEVRELVGDAGGELRAVVAQDTRTGERREIEAVAVFVLIGAEPQTRWLSGEVALDEQGFVLTGPDVARLPASGTAARGEPWHERGRPFLLETSLMGVFAAGDVRAGSVKRISSAAGEGCVAVHLIDEHLKTTGHPPA
ncbi:thioredoxin reductase [Sphaerisporangium krabiense]|uniref:Thioredoxin reductase (NADPH) n=1 Tax=Sphaerisporangium krabiense TaxID=763782 RepID=A0A7W8Z0N1_9ACTN|nr:FAD-dependent oxidoreductase [Sphaerisporangium krabiense]MBB5625287.1 thioredoxin reductase (NADPH) [Sphaerisporangium krabiense]GII64198.1 thioredoxin reductase [Sphaerisporangium krabiense]